MNSKVTTASFQKMKTNGEKISVLTAYDYTFAKLIDEAGIDAVLVGDSLGMVALGYPDTTKVTMQDMLHHTKAVVRGVTRAMVISDMPFMSYHTGVNEAVKNAGALIGDGGAQAVKLEGGSEITEEIKAIIRAGIPVMGHLGLTPQSVHKLGGYQVQARSKEKADKLINDAVELQEAGAFSIVLECIPCELAERVTDELSIPTIGIGAGVGCDGQVLVTPDMLGMYKDISPKFVKVYENVGKKILDSAMIYNNEVKKGIFPTIEHSFK
jgi:3-methyl-2-oxobutanoate hydroxymethyltransferase